MKLFRSTLLGLSFLFVLTSGYAKVTLPRLLTDNMVLQRNTPVKIWGWAAPGEKVEISFIDTIYQTTTDKSGEWYVMLASHHKGGPYTMKIKGSNSVELKNILLGDVYLCSGQSNMELPMRRVAPLYEKEITNATNNEIRYFAVPQYYNFKGPQKDLPSGNWELTTPENVLHFSAIAYFFALELNQKYNVPIGLINNSLGGSPAESWLSEEGLKKYPDLYAELLKYKNDAYIDSIKKSDSERIGNWYAQSTAKDEGYKIYGQNWKQNTLNTNDWQTMEIPGYWPEKQNGVVWFRKVIIVPESMVGKEVDLNMGRIVDADSVFINETFVGTTTYLYPPRWYTVPAGVLKPGKNTVVIRVINNAGKGGFVLGKPYELTTKDDTVSLQGEWKYKFGDIMEPLAPQTFIRWKPAGLYNAMLTPLTNFKISGVIWYQGESNVDRPKEYVTLFPDVIKCWRKDFGNDNLPFMFVQLANYLEPVAEPASSDWALVREAQAKALKLNNTAMAVAIDLGEWNDIHPLHKREVAQRLALDAEKLVYHENNILISGPVYKSMEIDGNKIVLTFSDTGSGLVAKNGELKEFAIAAADKKFVWANAKIENNTVVLWSDMVLKPVAVRYAWADNPDKANLYNKEGLPAVPFRSDDW